MEQHKIFYKNRCIGELEISKLEDGMSAKFTTNGNMDDVLKSIGAYKFNWYQICKKDTHPPFDLNGQQVNVPYIDPYPCGFALEKNKNFIYWNDGYPWYWDVSSVKTYKNF